MVGELQWVTDAAHRRLMAARMVYFRLNGATVSQLGHRVTSRDMEVASPGKAVPSSATSTQVVDALQ